MKGISTGNLIEYTSIRYLDPDTAKFERTRGGFLSLKIEPEEYYPRVDIFRAFPFTRPREYVSVRKPENKGKGIKTEEIGVIKNLNDFPPKIVELIEEQLGRRYFMPIIKRINYIKEEFGYYYWDVLTDVGNCRFTVRGGHNIVPISEDRERLLIIDVEGNRFEIPDYMELDDKSIRKLESIT